MKKTKKTLHQWSCPSKKVFLLRLETFSLTLFIFIVFIFSFILFNQNWLLAFLATLFFILIFIFITRLSRRVYPVRETYQLSPSGLSIQKQAGQKTTQTHIKFKDIKKFKLDRTFHGGRIETKEKKHSLYFNTKKELEKLEEILKSKIRKK